LCAPEKQRNPIPWIKNVQLPPYKHVINILHLSIVKKENYFSSCCSSFFPSNSLSEEQKEIKQEKDLKKKDIFALGFADLQKHVKEYILPLILKYFDLKEDFKEEDLQVKEKEYMDKATPKNDSFYDKDAIKHCAEFLSKYLKYKKDISP
jgi:hypothetical protein